MPAIHGGGSPDINFNVVASRPVAGVVEPKVCEGCTRQFFRPVVDGVSVQGGEKYCRDCRARKKPSAGVQ